MNFESNCGGADDELKMFENTFETKSTTATNVSVGCGTNDRTNSVGVSGKELVVILGKKLLLIKFRVIPLRCGIIMKRLV